MENSSQVVPKTKKAKPIYAVLRSSKKDSNLTWFITSTKSPMHAGLWSNKMEPGYTMSKAKGAKPEHVLPNADDVNPKRVCPRKKKENSMWMKSRTNEEDPGCIKLLADGIKST